ncbi:chemotaxis protein CheW [Geomonas subterranea]|uniref:Chemotaxis protein CheW n=1 Tax=Geomonas subterranea TaxID=2847989 RepID=A0ABX8LBJ5_9BACT|nr:MULTISPECIES: chemotaxis protein CheW [Geomonas]QXE89388.1 chemotaxis protein CheW [Geomonas subterranea]QXM08496.1 chemotaxis protein CheW [Geomonas subterranea]
MTPQRLLLFSAARQLFALNLQEVCEVMEPQQCYPFAGAPPHYLGLINFHGNLTALVDLAGFLGLKSRPLPGKLLVIDTKLAHLALKVDAVGSILDAASITGAGSHDDPLTEALLETPQGSVRLLRLEALLGGLEQELRDSAPNTAKPGGT